jgi:hypothetical protein
MKGSGSHLHAKAPPSTVEGLSGLASRRVDGYHVISNPIIASIHYEAFTKHLTSYVEKGWLSPSPLILSILILGFRAKEHNSTTEAREAYSSAVPGTLYGRLR